ncbi:hypothetical protein GCM10012275_08930 [Longimycelium tulufanense]|uniref:Metallothionein n=1 Tax=Longimycelium tulufanense TaxID=907463 RepID=A0A8J3FTI4_9PSEU|nr:hypothetical protein [Longimycelium tulufanense]GGM40173.1 hypothetical protein GCM10012275_08930 [Longimycelium tulufanense]
MSKVLESVSGRLLSLFVPKVEAAAALPECECFPRCWQCAGSRCCVNTKCGSINCYYKCPGC